MTKEIVAFYVKGRPQGADIIDLVLRHSRVFIGHPPFRQDTNWNRQAVRSSILDISVSDDQWRPNEIDKTWHASFKSQITRNRNLARQIGVGSIAVVPRTTEGRCYIGKVAAPFELEENPPWADEYLELRRRQGVADQQPEMNHIGDVVQCWRVEEWRPVPFPLVPRWIQYQVMGRTTIGVIKGRPDGRRSALTTLEDLYQGRTAPSLPPTADLDEIAGRLLDWVSPSGLEHLMCDLLQREQPGTRWWHVGGSGDGGSDGIGIDPQGNVVGVLQCKWQLSDDPVKLAGDILLDLQPHWGSGVRAYIATYTVAVPCLPRYTARCFWVRTI